MKSLILFVTIFSANTSFGQYLDIPGEVVRNIETYASDTNSKSTKKVSLAYLGTSPTTVIENMARVPYNPLINSMGSISIDYFKYNNMCDNYWNPFKKQSCKNKLNYLKEAHGTILLLINSTTYNKVDQGVKELIFQKYANTTNTIFKELEEMKIEADKYGYLRFLSN